MTVERLIRGSLFLGLSFGMASSALVSEVQANSWLSSEQAFLQTLDKITARIATVAVTLNQPVQFGTLQIELKRVLFPRLKSHLRLLPFWRFEMLGLWTMKSLTKLQFFQGGCSPRVLLYPHWNTLFMMSRFWPVPNEQTHH